MTGRAVVTAYLREREATYVKTRAEAEGISVSAYIQKLVIADAREHNDATTDKGDIRHLARKAATR